MILSPDIPFKVTTSGYEVISSGVVHITEPEITFNLANLVIKYIFKNEPDVAPRYDGKAIDGEMVISLVNFSNPLGEGIIKPVEIGTLGGKKLFTTCFVHSPGGSFRQFNYTFMTKEA